MTVRLPRKLGRALSGGQLKEAGRLTPVGGLDVTLNMIPLHRASMTLSERDLPLAMHDLVEIYGQNGSLGVFRVTSAATTFRKDRKYELTHGLDVFSDAHFAVIEEYRGTVAGFLAKIVAAQTQKINGIPYWRLGQVDDTAVWNKDIEYTNLMECLTEIARTEEDFQFVYDMSSFPWTLSFIRRDSAVLSEFRLRHNTESCQITLDDADLCTRLHLSVTTETSETVTDKDGQGHTIITTQEGYYTFDNAAGQALYGIVAKTAGVDRMDVPTEADLNAWVAAYFARHGTPAVQISVSGVELNRLTGSPIDEMHIGRICRVALPDYGSVFNERIVSVQYPDILRQPTVVKVSLANKKETAEGSFSRLREQTSRAGGAASSAKKLAHNTEAEQTKQKIIYDLQVEKDEKRFTILATEQEWSDAESAYEITHKSYFEQTARGFSDIVMQTGVSGTVWDWSPDDTYEPGDYVRYNGTIYKCVTQHTGSWDPSCFTEVQSQQSQIDQTAEMISQIVSGLGAKAFSTTQAYAVGDYVTFGGDTYRFIAAHSAGAWDPSQVVQVSGTVSEVVQSAAGWSATVSEVETARGASSSLSTALSLKANKATLISEINDSSGGTIAASLLEVQPGSVLIQAINGGTGHSNIRLEADTIDIDGFITALQTKDLWVTRLDANDGEFTGSLTVDDNLTVLGDIVGGDITGADATFDSLTVNGVALDGELIVSASVNTATNTLTLTKASGQTVNFSKAIAPTIGGDWNNGVYTVTSDITPAPGSVTATTLFDLGLGTPTLGTGSTVEATYNIGYAAISGGQQVRGGSTGKVGTLSLDVSSLLQTKTVTPATTRQTFTPDNNKLGFSQVIVEAATNYSESDVVNTVSAVSNPVAGAGGVWYGDITVTKHLPATSTGTAQTFQIDVQAAVNAGVAAAWDAAYGQMIWPGAGSATTFNVSGPASAVYTGQTKTFTLYASGAYIYCKDGTNDVARCGFHGTITAASAQSSVPSGNKLREVTVGTGGTHTYIRVSSSGYRSNNDYIQINY